MFCLLTDLSEQSGICVWDTASLQFPGCESMFQEVYPTICALGPRVRDDCLLLSASEAAGEGASAVLCNQREGRVIEEEDVDKPWVGGVGANG